MIKHILGLGVCMAFLMGGLGHAADPEAGKAKSETCSLCHGANGNSNESVIPNLAGQQPLYIKIQLQAFKDGSRKHLAMNTMATPLSGQDMEDLAAYFAGQNPTPREVEKALAAKGREKYNLCKSCHGPMGAGQGINPRLAGQHPDYTIQQLRAFKNGNRQNPLMNNIAASLSEETIQALAEYVAGLK
jgi:cytochrome c553